MKLFSDFEKTRSEWNRIQDHLSSNKGMAENPDEQWRTQMLQYLAGNIVVKEHRQRYQKEQYDRFLYTINDRALKSGNISLQEFCFRYSQIIEAMIEESHNYRSPKIEANYDDFAEKTVRPINATIFYYFFSLDKRRKTVAQWLISSIRYPNEKVRQAYMRFFA